MTGGGDFGLRRKNIAADGALGAIRQTLFGAGRRLARNGFFLVAGRGNHFLRNENLVADFAVLALGLAGFGAGRLDPCVNDLGMALGGNLFLRSEDFVTDGAVLALGLAGRGASSCNSFVNDLGVSLGGDDLAILHLLFADGAVGIAGVAILSAGGVLGITELRILVCARRTAPDATDIVDGVASLGALRFGVGAVGIVQLGGGDGDLMCRHVGIDLRVLIRRGLRAGSALLVVDTGAVAGADVRTALGGVDAAVGGQRTVDVHLHIDKVCFCAVIMLSRGIWHRFELASGNKVLGDPLITVIDIDALAAGHHQLGVLGDGGLHAGQQCRRLVDSQLAASDQIDGHVVGQRQNIAAGADACSRQLQVQAVDLRHTVDGIMDAVGGAVIRLGQTAGDDFEHTVVADKGNGGGVDLSYGVYRSIHRLAGAGVQGQGYLHILHGVLAKGEHLVAHIRRCAAAAEVQNLVPLVDGAAGLYGDSTAAGDEAPCVQACAGLHGDGAAGLHFDIAIGPDHLARSAA